MENRGTCPEDFRQWRSSISIICGVEVVFFFLWAFAFPSICSQVGDPKLVGGLEHGLLYFFHFIYMGYPSHWRTPSFFSRWLLHHQPEKDPKEAFPTGICHWWVTPDLGVIPMWPSPTGSCLWQALEESMALYQHCHVAWLGMSCLRQLWPGWWWVWMSLGDFYLHLSTIQ